jgi:hypothetical protein
MFVRKIINRIDKLRKREQMIISAGLRGQRFEKSEGKKKINRRVQKRSINSQLENSLIPHLTGDCEPTTLAKQQNL